MSPAKLTAFTLGQVGMMMLARFFFQWILSFAASGPSPEDETLFSAAAVGTALLAFRIFDGVTDPLAGMLGDAWSRKGRPRQQLLWAAFLIPSLGVGLTFTPTHTMEVTSRWALLLSGMFVFFVGYTFYAIPYWSLVDDYAGDDPRARTRLSNLLGAGLLVATGIGFVVSPMLVDQLGFQGAAWSLAAVAAPLMTLPYFAAPDDDDAAKAPPDPPEDPRGDEGQTTRGLESIKTALRDRDFLAVIVLFGGSQMSLTIMTAAAPFIAVDLLGGSTADVALLLGPLLAAALPVMLFTPALARRVGWRAAVVGATALLACVYGGTGALGGTLVHSPMVTAATLFALGGPMIAVLLGLEGEAIAESARARAPDAVSVYFGVYNFVVKALNGIAIAGAGVLAEQARGDWGVAAVRAMSAAAGAVLLLGFALYLAARVRARRRDRRSPPAR